MVEFKTTFNEKTNKYFAGRQLKKVLPIMAVLCILLIALGLVFMFTNEKYDADGFLSEDYVSGITLIVLGGFLFAFFLLIIIVAQKNTYKSSPLISEQTLTEFTFDEREFTVRATKGEEYESFVRSGYSLIHKAEETKTHYLIYVSNAQSYVIDKSGLIKGTLLEMNSYLSQNLGKKFKYLNK